MSVHDDMMRLHAVPTLFGQFGDSDRVLAHDPGSTAPIPLEVTGIGPIRSEKEEQELGNIESVRDVERRVVSLKVNSVCPGVDWRLEIDRESDKMWTIDRTSTNANGAINLHVERYPLKTVRRAGMER